MYVRKKDKKEGVSAVIAVILMVAITVVLAAVLFVMVQRFTQTQSEIVTPLGIGAVQTNSTHWSIPIQSNSVDAATTSFQLQKGGVGVGGNYTVSDATTVKATSWDSNAAIQWFDNDQNDKISPGDTIVVKKPSGASGDYTFIATNTGTQVISVPLTA